MVAPISARMLLELGARVIKIESAGRPDPVRGLGGSSASYHMINAGKDGLSLDLSNESGRAILMHLIAKADVLIESFTPGVIDKMGFAYEELSRLNPKIVMASTGILGRKGPFGLGTSGTGSTGSAFAGATRLMGVPDRLPDGPSGPWTDAVAPRYLVPAILAALRNAEKTGRGMHIDLAQAEAGIEFFLPAAADSAVNARIADAPGNVLDPLRAPCAAYQVAGSDRWVVIDASDPKPYAELAKLVGGILEEPRFHRLIERLRHRSLIDRAIGSWVAGQDGTKVERLLQSHGIPAHVASQDEDLVGSSDLREAGFLEELQHDDGQTFEIPGPLFRLDSTPAPERRKGPAIGQSNAEILRDVLGYSEEQIENCHSEGALG